MKIPNFTSSKIKITYQIATKNLFFVLVLLVSTLGSYGQITLGLKGGLNLNFSKEANINGLFITNNANTTFNSENDLGFHAGIMAEFDIQKLGIVWRPEILFTRLNYEYAGLIIPESQKLIVQKLDIPLLIGIPIKGPFRVLIGPSFQFVLNSEFELEEFKETQSDSFAMNAHIGLGLKFENFDVDLRWEIGLTNSEVNFTTEFENIGLNFDTAPNQLILALAYRFKLKKIKALK